MTTRSVGSFQNYTWAWLKKLKKNHCYVGASDEVSLKSWNIWKVINFFKRKLFFEQYLKLNFNMCQKKKNISYNTLLKNEVECSKVQTKCDFYNSRITDEYVCMYVCIYVFVCLKLSTTIKYQKPTSSISDHSKLNFLSFIGIYCYH